MDSCPFARVFACFSLYYVFETWPYGQVFLGSLSGDAGRQIVSRIGVYGVMEVCGLLGWANKICREAMRVSFEPARGAKCIPQG